MALMGSGGPTISLTTPVAVSFGPTGNLTAATAGYAIDPDGFVYTSAGVTISYVQAEQWNTSPPSTGNYQVLVTATGTTPTASDTLGVWNTMTTRQTWGLISPRPAGGTSKTCVLTVQIRDTATSTVRATATVTLTADST